VTLDNSQEKIPIEAKELVICKTYHAGTGKEEYLLNGKHILKTDLFTLFESGGFSL